MPKQKSKFLFLIAVIIDVASRHNVCGFVRTAAPRASRHFTKVTTKTPFITSRPTTTPTQLNYDLSGVFQPLTSTLTAVQDGSLPQAVQQMTQTLFFSPGATSMSTAHVVQTVGETAFAGILAIAAAQGALIMKQYQNNPSGGLIVPPGLTEGVEDASDGTNKVIGGFVEDTASFRQDVSTSLKRKAPLTDQELEAMVCDTQDNVITCSMKKQWYHVTTQIMAIALVPVAAMAGPSMGLAAWMMRYGHIMHMAVIFGLTHIYDFFRKLPSMEEICGSSTLTKALEEEPVFGGEHPRVLVLGDSMSVGIGTCEVFDDKKVYYIPLHKEEHLASSPDELKNSKALPGPVFPRVLAQTLSKRFDRPVAWRSAGVDGGATVDIAEHLLGVVQDEVDKGHAPDLVVVLTGSNDLKYILNGAASVKGFRSNLMDLAAKIRNISPHSRVVFPALPTYRMDTQSILNVFPLSICLDSIMGVWDSQKMAVADHCPGVMHVDLKVKDVNSWYQPDDGETPKQEISLISADGIHPNARCYAKWGEFVGNDLADQIMMASVKKEQKYQRQDEPRKQGLPQPAYAGGFSLSSTFGVVKNHR